MTAHPAERGELSGLADLHSWLTRIREIAALPDSEALTATDTLLWSAAEIIGAGPEAEEDWDAVLVGEQLERVQETCERLREALTHHAGDLRLADAEHLRRQASELGMHAGREAREKHAAAIVQARAEADGIAGQVEAACWSAQVRGAGAEIITTASQAYKLMATVDRALAQLEERDALTAELLKEGRGAKVRAARWRAEKRLAEADVIAAGGNQKRAARLRAEAEEMWKQDAARAFPGELPPPLTDSPRFP